MPNESGQMRNATKSKAKGILSRSNHPEYVEINSNQVVMEGGSLSYDVSREQSESFLNVMSKYKRHLENSHPCMDCHVFLMDTPHQQEIYAIV